MWVCSVDPGDRSSSVYTESAAAPTFSLLSLPPSVAVRMFRLTSIRRSLSAKLISHGQLNRDLAGPLAS
jgi:hypothetical protein